jgi:ubiquinone/menaquinone biosynthesis C-methylase UbiE
MSDPSQHRAFREFEHAAWKTLARGYHENFASLTRQAVDPLLDAASVRRGARVLDACTGPGYAAAAATERRAIAVGMDFSSAMIAEACRTYPETEFVVGDAEDLPFRNKSFDAVVTNFGLLHLSRPEQFLSEAGRILRSGGKVAFSVWAPPQEAIGFSIILDAILAHGNPEAPLPPGPPFFRFSEEAECRKVLLSAGFENANVARAAQVWSFADPDGLFRAMLEGTARTGGLLWAQTPEALAAIREIVRRDVEPLRASGMATYNLPMPAVIASAVKP